VSNFGQKEPIRDLFQGGFQACTEELIGNRFNKKNTGDCYKKYGNY